MYYGNIKPFAIEDGPGVRVALFVSGCRNCCKGCFQRETWSFSYGEEFTKESEELILNYLRPDYIAGLTLLGGEPFEPENQEPLLHLVRRVREELPNKNIWAYTGNTLEEMTSIGHRSNTPFIKELLKQIDVLVDGRFIEEKKDIRLNFCGSTNQRIIDMKETIKSGRIVILPINEHLAK